MSPISLGKNHIDHSHDDDDNDDDFDDTLDTEHDVFNSFKTTLETIQVQIS
jgi:hypothetical protein